MPDFETVLRSRRSVRGYLPETIPPQDICEIFTLAGLAPSNCNIQPWQMHLVSGAALRALGKKMVEAARNGAPPAPDIIMDTRYQGVFRQRQIGAAVALYSAIKVERDDHQGRIEAHLRNLDAFGAPHAVFLFLPEGFGLREASDLGGFAQTLMLTLTSRGLGSCAQGALSLYPDILRDHLGLPQGAQLVMGISFGKEDPLHPANAARTDRAPLEELLTRHD